MDYTIDFLYLCLFFPLWTCLLITCGFAFLPFNSKKMTTVFSFLSALFPVIFSLLAGIKHLSFEYNFSFFSINEINFLFGTLINNFNIILIGILNLCFLSAIVLNYKMCANDKNYNQNLFLINILIFLALGFFTSPNVIQLFVFYAAFCAIFYWLENIKNDNHERAKNFLVLNKIGDFALCAVIGIMFYYGTFFEFQDSANFLGINDINYLFEGIQSVSETNSFVLLISLFLIAIFIKSILVLIHPLKSVSDRILLISLSFTSGLYWLIVFMPAFKSFEYFNLLFYLIAAIFIVFAGLTLYLKRFHHAEVLKINAFGTNIIKNIYLNIAKCIKYFDDNYLDKIYENISKISMMFSGYFQFPSKKTTIYALIFNILGICFLILLAWIIYSLTMKG